MNGSYTYVYLVGSLLFVPIWLLLFWRLPGARREMLAMSALFVCIGVPMEALLYTRDWWHPTTITGTRVGVEDFIYSIGNGGYMAALYGAITRSGYERSAPPPSLWLRVAPVVCLVVLPLSLVYGFGVHSFVATSVGSLVALAIVLGARPDLARVAIGTGVVGTMLAIPVYVAMEAIFPGSIAATWDLPHLSGLLPLGIPIEDLLWYLYTCALWGTYYKFATGLRMESQASPRSLTVAATHSASSD
jgi:Lycopene cyclase